MTTLAPASIDMRRYQTQLLPIDTIFCDHSFNCRGRIARSDCMELKDSVAEHGLEFPIHVQKFNDPEGKYKYRIVSGHRRWTACKMLNWETIPAIIRDDLKDEVAAKDANLIENLQRSDLNIVQEAEALSFYVLRGFSVNEIAHRLNKSNGWVEVRRRLVHLPEFVRNAANKGIVNHGHINQLWNYRDNPEKLSELIRSIKERKEKGEKFVKIKEDVKILDFVKPKRPKPHELLNFMQHLGQMITNKLPDGEENFAHLCLAWCSGNISEAQIWAALKRECERRNFKFNPPDDVARIFNSVNNV